MVDLSFDIYNGMTGMNRDIFFQMFYIIEMESKMEFRRKDQCIRAIMGMCQEHLFWKTHSHFKKNQTALPYTFFSATPFRRNPDGECEVVVSGGEAIERWCLFHAGSYRTIFLDREISKGVYQWTARIKYSSPDNSCLRIGVAPTDLLSKCDNYALGMLGKTCCFSMAQFTVCRETVPRSSVVIKRLTLDGAEEYDYESKSRMAVDDNSLVTVEVDVDASTLVFSINGRELPTGIGGVYAPLHLGISGLGRPSFASVCFLRLRSPTQPKLCRRFYKCKSK